MQTSTHSVLREVIVYCLMRCLASGFLIVTCVILENGNLHVASVNHSHSLSLSLLHAPTEITVVSPHRNLLPWEQHTIAAVKPQRRLFYCQERLWSLWEVPALAHNRGWEMVSNDVIFLHHLLTEYRHRKKIQLRHEVTSWGFFEKQIWSLGKNLFSGLWTAAAAYQQSMTHSSSKLSGKSNLETC